MFVVVMNILGLIFMTAIVGEISVLISNISTDKYQADIDIANTAMRHANLTTEL